MSAQTSTTATVGNQHDREYHDFLEAINQRFRANCEGGDKPLFKTDAQGLWEQYLDSFTDPAERQHHNCHACKAFITRYGGLATIEEDGSIRSAIWDEDDAPEIYEAGVSLLARAVRRAKVTDVFHTWDLVLGTPRTGPWDHFAVYLPKGRYEPKASPAAVGRVTKRQEFLILNQALLEWSLEHLEAAVALLKGDRLVRSEKVVAQAVFLRDLAAERQAIIGPNRANVIWRAVATAPAGFCHPRSGMLGTLLDDIAAGKTFDQIARSFGAKMDPLKYQRPQAPPTAGAIAAAEKLMEEMGAAAALRRRFARLDEVQALWRPPVPVEAQQQPEGVFGHLQAKGSADPHVHLELPPEPITWDKFQRQVLPDVVKIEVQVPDYGPFSALTTAADPEAPPIIQWDSAEARNPVSWYLWNSGSHAYDFSLTGGAWYEVAALCHLPSMWNGGMEHHGQGVFLLIDGARDLKRLRNLGGNGLFPETLRSEFHGIRSVIEAYSRKAKLEGEDEPYAAGLLLKNGTPWGARIRVRSTASSLRIPYILERWD